MISNLGVLAVRAALMPSTPRRTLVVSVTSTVPILVVAYLVQRNYHTDQAMSFAVSTAMVALVIIPIPAMISGVVYNLGEKVRRATQLGQYHARGEDRRGGHGRPCTARATRCSGGRRPSSC